MEIGNESMVIAYSIGILFFVAFWIITCYEAIEGGKMGSKFKRRKEERERSRT